MIPDNKYEPIRDEHGGEWSFYKGQQGDFQYSYILRLPPEIHNYVIARYVGTSEQGPLPDDFRFTPTMVEDVAQKWDMLDGGSPDDRVDMVALRAALEETIHHRYYLAQEWTDLDIEVAELSTQREKVVNDPLDSDQLQDVERLLASIDIESIDFNSIYQRIDQGWLDAPQEAPDALIRQELLTPEKPKFRDMVESSLKNLQEHMKKFTEHIKEFSQRFDFGR